METSDLESKIRRFLRTQLGVDDGAVTLETQLVTTGLIDSVGLVRLVTFLEEETRISVPNRDITVDNFDTLRRIQDYLTRRVAERLPSGRRW